MHLYFLVSLFLESFKISQMNLKSLKLVHLLLLVVTTSVIYILSQIIFLRRIHNSNTNILINYHENVIINAANEKSTAHKIKISFDIKLKESYSQTKQSVKQAFKFQHITDKKQAPSLNAIAQKFGKIRGINSKDIERYKPDSEGFFTCLHSKVYSNYIV